MVVLTAQNVSPAIFTNGTGKTKKTNVVLRNQKRNLADREKDERDPPQSPDHEYHHVIRNSLPVSPVFRQKNEPVEDSVIQTPQCQPQQANEGTLPSFLYDL